MNASLKVFQKGVGSFTGQYFRTMDPNYDNKRRQNINNTNKKEKELSGFIYMVLLFKHKLLYSPIEVI